MQVGYFPPLGCFCSELAPGSDLVFSGSETPALPGLALPALTCPVLRWHSSLTSSTSSRAERILGGQGPQLEMQPAGAQTQRDGIY